MAKLTLTDITSGYALTTTVNANNALIEAALENTLSRDGTAPNTMSAVLDMNSYNINNLPDATQNQQPVTLAQAATLAGVTNPLTRETVGAVFYPETSAETSATVTPTNYYYEPGDVRRYGATGDGVTDDTTALQDAGDSNGTITVPKGTYIVSNLAFTTEVEIILEKGATIKHKDASADHMIESTADLYVKGGVLDGNKAGQTGRYIVVKGTGNVLVVEGVHIKNSVDSGVTATGVSELVRVTGCRFTGMDEHGGGASEVSQCIDIETTSDVVEISNNVFIGDTPSTVFVAVGGVIVSGTSNSCRITGNYFEKIGQNNTSNGNFIAPINLYTDADESVVSNNIFIDSYYSPMKLQNSNNVTCTGNVISGYSGDGSAGAMLVFQHARSNATAIVRGVIANNVIDINGNTTNTAIYITGDSAGVLSMYNVVVSGNVIEGGLRGISVEWVTDITIIGNSIRKVNTQCIEIGRLADDPASVSIIGNNFWDAETVYIQSVSTDNNDGTCFNITGNNFYVDTATPSYFVQLKGHAGATLHKVVLCNNVGQGSTATADFQVQYADVLVATGNAMTDDVFSTSNITLEREVGNSWQVMNTYTPTNVVTDRSYNANATTTEELADVLGTLIADLQQQGIIK